LKVGDRLKRDNCDERGAGILFSVETGYFLSA